MEPRESFFPSKKIVYLLIACVIAVGAIVGAVQYPAIQARIKAADMDTTDSTTTKKGTDTYIANESPTAAENAALNSILAEASRTDTDGDGLKDWEETLWKTNPNKADTDGDGTSDGEEVRLGRNPLIALKKGQDDTLAANSQLNQATNSAQPDENLTETDKFGRELFYKYMAAKKAGNLDQTKLIQDFVDEQSLNTAAKQYKETDFIVIPPQNTTDTTLRDYGNALGRALASHPAKGVPNEFQTITNAVKSKSAAQLRDLDPVITGYQGILQDFLRIAVPRSMVSAHIALLNSVEMVLEDVRGFKKTFSDPIIGLMSINKYPGDIESLKTAIQNMRDAFETQGIVFEQAEYGYILVHAI